MTKNLLRKFSISIGDDARGRNDFLKILAIVSMTIDHIGAIFFPDIPMLRIIGRLALPIFAAAVADGFLYTSNFRIYFLRIFIVGLVAQIPYVFLFNMLQVNILLTFSVALLILWALREKKYVIFVLCVLAFFYVNFEYGFYCLIMILLYSELRGKKVLLMVAQSILVSLNAYFVGPLYVLYQTFGVALPIFVEEKWLRININKYFFYYFYPGHLLLLLLIKNQVMP